MRDGDEHVGQGRVGEASVIALIPDPVATRAARVDAARRLAAVFHLLAGQMSPDYIEAVPTIDLPNDELAAVAAAIRRLIADDKFPHAPRLDPLRARLARLDAALASKPPSHPKAPPAAKADKRARR